MKKLLCTLVAAALLCACFSGCAAEEEIVLNVFNWGEYIADGDGEWTYVDEDGNETEIPYLDINAEFEDYYYEKYGKRVRVNYTTYASNEEMYAKLTTSSASYDIIIPSDYLIPRLIENGYIQPIHLENIPNYANLGEKYVVDGLSFVENEAGEKTYYSATYTFGKVCVIYNLTQLEEIFEDFDAEEFEAEGFGVLWNEKYKDAGILQFNNSRDAFATAQFRLAAADGANPSDYINPDLAQDGAEKLDAALTLLKDQQHVIQKYVMDETFNKMESGNACVAPYYVGDFFTMYANNEDDELCCFYPEEGSNSFFDAMCVPTSSLHPEIAEEYINFMLSVDEDPAKSIAENNAEYICYATPNEKVQESETYQYFLENEMHPDAQSLLYGEDLFDFEREGFAALDGETQQYLNECWDKLKIQDGEEEGSALGPICIVLAFLLCAFLVFIGVRKKIRSHYWQ